MVYHPPPAVDPETTKPDIKASLKTVEDKMATLNSEKKIRLDQGEVLDTYSKTVNAEKSDGKSLVQFLDLYMERKRAIHQDVQALQVQISDLEKEAANLRKELWQDDAGQKRKVKVSVVALAASDGKARLVLSYGEHCDAKLDAC